MIRTSPAPIGGRDSANVWGWNVVDEWRRANERVSSGGDLLRDSPAARAERQVRYWVKFGDEEFRKTTDYRVVLRQAEELCARERHRDDRPKRQGQWGPASHSSPLGRTRSPRASDSSTSESHHL